MLRRIYVPKFCAEAFVKRKHPHLSYIRPCRRKLDRGDACTSPNRTWLNSYTATTIFKPSEAKVSAQGGEAGKVKAMRKLLREEAGVEPIVMKLLAAVVLLAIGLSIGVALYKRAGGMAENALENLENIG